MVVYVIIWLHADINSISFFDAVASLFRYLIQANFQIFLTITDNRVPILNAVFSFVPKYSFFGYWRATGTLSCFAGGRGVTKRDGHFLTSTQSTSFITFLFSWMRLLLAFIGNFTIFLFCYWITNHW